MSFRRKYQDNFWVNIYLYLEYFVFRSMTLFLLSMKLKTAMKTGAFIGNIIMMLDRAHTERTFKHLRMAYKDKITEKRVREIARGVYRHFGQVMVEMLFFRRLVRHYNWQKFLSFENEHYLAEALNKGKGTLLTGGHLGNWEISGCILIIRGYDLVSIARPLDNPYVDRFLNSFRTQTGQNIIEKWGAMKGTLRALKGNRIVGMLVDQDARKNGIFVQFFGMPSSTLPMPAQLALKYKATILPFYSYRVKENEMKYVFGFYPPISAAPSGDYERDVREITQQLASYMEESINKHPEQWLWMHRRWKTKLLSQ